MGEGAFQWVIGVVQPPIVLTVHCTFYKQLKAAGPAAIEGATCRNDGKNFDVSILFWY